MPTAAVFADVQNIYYTTRDTYGSAFNYRQFWQITSERFDITHAYAYAIKRDDERQRRFQSALQHIGFELKLKPYIQRRDGSAKGDWDVGITIDVMDTASQVDCVILLSGDGDFDQLASRVISREQCDFEVFAVAALTAQSLIDAATRFHPITPELLM